MQANKSPRHAPPGDLPRGYRLEDGIWQCQTLARLGYIG